MPRIFLKKGNNKKDGKNYRRFYLSNSGSIFGKTEADKSCSRQLGRLDGCPRCGVEGWFEPNHSGCYVKTRMKVASIEAGEVISSLL